MSGCVVAAGLIGNEVLSNDDFAKALENHFAVFGTHTPCACRFHRAIKKSNDEADPALLDYRQWWLDRSADLRVAEDRIYMLEAALARTRQAQGKKV